MTRLYQTNSSAVHSSNNLQQQRKGYDPNTLDSIFQNGTLQKKSYNKNKQHAKEAPHIRQLDYLFHGRNTIMLSSHGVDPSVLHDPAYPFVDVKSINSENNLNQANQTTSFSKNTSSNSKNKIKQASSRKEYCIQNIIPTLEIQKPFSKIGYGGFGTVFKAVRKQKVPSRNQNQQLSYETVERQVAIKEHTSVANLKDKPYDERMKILRDIVEEGKIHKDYKHDYIIGLEGFWLDDEAFNRDFEDWTTNKDESSFQKYHTTDSPFAYPKLCIVLEYAAGGSLYLYLKQRNSMNTDDISQFEVNNEKLQQQQQQHKLSPEDLISWTKQVVGATKFLHDKYLIHCDIKSQNVLLSLNVEKLLEAYGQEEGNMIKEQLFNQDIEPHVLDPCFFTLKLTDFGTAKIIEKDGKIRMVNKPQSLDNYYNSVRTNDIKLMGTSAWMAPELFKAVNSQENSKASDIWSLGVLLWEILTGRQPYQGVEHIAIGMWVCQDGQKLHIPDNAPAIYQEILRMCWAKAAKDRISAEEIIEKLDEFNINQYDSYRTINALEYQEQLQTAIDLLQERSKGLDLEQDKIKWRADMLTVREKQFDEEKNKLKKDKEILDMERRKTMAKEDLIRLLTTSEHYTKHQVVTDKMRKYRKILAKRIKKNKIKIEVDRSKFQHLPGTADFSKFEADGTNDNFVTFKNIPNIQNTWSANTYGTPSSFSMDRSGHEEAMSSKSSSSNYQYFNRTKPNSPKINSMNFGNDNNRLKPLQPPPSIPNNAHNSTSSGYQFNSSNNSSHSVQPRYTTTNSTSSNICQVTNNNTNSSDTNTITTINTQIPKNSQQNPSFSPQQLSSSNSNYVSPTQLPPPVPKMENPHLPNNSRNPPPIPRRPDDEKLQNFTRKHSINKLTNNPAILANSKNDTKKYDPQNYRPRIHGKEGGFQRNPEQQIDLKNVAEQLLQTSQNTNSNNNNSKTRSLERGINGLSKSDSISSLDNLPDATTIKEKRASTVHRMNSSKTGK